MRLGLLVRAPSWGLWLPAGWEGEAVSCGELSFQAPSLYISSEVVSALEFSRETSFREDKDREQDGSRNKKPLIS